MGSEGCRVGCGEAAKPPYSMMYYDRVRMNMKLSNEIIRASATWALPPNTRYGPERSGENERIARAI